MILDCEDNTLSFEKNYEFLGVAFRGTFDLAIFFACPINCAFFRYLILIPFSSTGLPIQQPLYPAVSAVYGNTEVSMVYLGPPMDG